MRALAALLLALPLPAENWPGFRGPSGQGVSSETNVPVKWSETENVAWKIPIPGLGWSSPIVWEGRVFLTTALRLPNGHHEGRILVIDAATGRILWNQPVHTMTVTHNRDKNSHATPTPVTDGRRVYAVFADGAIAATGFNGKLLWKNTEADYYSEHGLGASPVLFEDILIMPFSGSCRGCDDKRVGWQIPWDKSYILALDAATGKRKWRGERGLSRIGHVTPALHRVNGKPELVSPMGDVIQGFDPYTGALKWTVRSRGEGVVPSAVIGDGLIFTSSGFEATTMRTVRAGAGSGDITATAIAWEQPRGASHIPSFLYRKPWLFTVTEAGIAQCLQAATGEILWQQRLGGNYSASPVLANGLIYFPSEEGETVVIRASDQFEEVARNRLAPEMVQASPAISGGAIFLRTRGHLYRIGK
jgi:outer membrane protein assembly factor BamB